MAKPLPQGASRALSSTKLRGGRASGSARQPHAGRASICKDLLGAVVPRPSVQDSAASPNGRPADRPQAFQAKAMQFPVHGNRLYNSILNI